jgi:hypothetical protein
MENRPNPTGKTTMAITNLIEFLHLFAGKRAICWVHNEQMVNYTENLMKTVFELLHIPRLCLQNRLIALQNGSTVEIRSIAGISRETVLRVSRTYDVAHIDHHVFEENLLK